MLEIKKYILQLKAFFWSSLLIQIRTPLAILMGLVFPLVFVLIFNLILDFQPQSQIKLGLLKEEAQYYQEFKNNFTDNSLYDLSENVSISTLEKQLQAGDIDIYIQLQKIRQNQFNPEEFIPRLQGENSQDSEVEKKIRENNLEVKVFFNQNQKNKILVLKETLKSVNQKFLIDTDKLEKPVYQIKEFAEEVKQERALDFLIPGILGYSIIFSAIFGIALSHINWSKKLVIKRIFATPTNTSAFILGNSLSRFVFILSQSVLLLFVMSYLFDYWPEGGWLGISQIIFILSLSTVTFLGLGYFVAGVSQNSDVVTGLANFFIYPQIILSGAFFEVEKLPFWIQSFAISTPMYRITQAIQAINLRGLNVWDWEVLSELSFLFIWTVFIYFLASYFFRVRKI